MAWEGTLAEGFPGLIMAFFAPARSPEAYAALAWFLEDGMRKFYENLAGMLSETDAVNLFSQLALVEEHHKSELTKLYHWLSGEKANAGFPYGIVSEQSQDELLEGGISLKEALSWAIGKQTKEILELSIALETSAYDRYLAMKHNVEDIRSQQLFELLSQEEKRHLGRMTELLAKTP